ncbi:MAG: DinB family protein [Saprospiraceae bacterium]
MKKYTFLSFYLLLVGLTSFAQTTKTDILKAPANWKKESFTFPLDFAPKLQFTGIEEARFAPGWSDKKSEEFWTYSFAWYVDGNINLTEQRLQTFIGDYFNGLTQVVGGSKGMKKEAVSNAFAIFMEKESVNNWQYFEGKVQLFDVFFSEQEMRLNVKVKGLYCEVLDKHLVLFSFAPKAFEDKIWNVFEEVQTVADCAALSNPQLTRTPKTDFTKMYLPIWQEAMKHCLEVANAMPENLYSYKPTEVSKTFAEQMVHIAMSTQLLTKRYVQGMKVEPVRLDASKMTKAEIINLLKERFAYTTNVILTIEQAQLDELCIMYHSKNEVSRAFALFYVQDHLANHRAKANLYVRMNGIEPPHYTW